MNLDTSKWKWFNLNNLFEIKAGNYHYPEEYDVGETAYVSASNENNGISARINLAPEFKGNCIITGKVGCTAFYQNEDFCATSDINIFTPKFKNFNYLIGLFIKTVINYSENYKWSYGRQCRINNCKKINIKLPILYNKDGTEYIDKTYKYSKDGFVPDWQFMENYIKSLHCNPITTKNKKNNKFKLYTKSWKEFNISKLFYVELSKGDIKLDNVSLGEFPLVSAGETNNGIIGYIDEKADGKAEIFEGNKITVDMFGNAYYQNDAFFSVSHGRVNILTSKFDMDKYIGLFISTIIKNERYKYSYGRAVYSYTLENMNIKLPIRYNEDNSYMIDETKTYSEEGYVPDWEFMENYIKSLPYGDRI